MRLYKVLKYLLWCGQYKFICMMMILLLVILFWWLIWLWARYPTRRRKSEGTKRLFPSWLIEKTIISKPVSAGYVDIRIQASDRYIDWNGIILQTEYHVELRPWYSLSNFKFQNGSVFTKLLTSLAFAVSCCCNKSLNRSFSGTVPVSSKYYVLIFFSYCTVNKCFGEI